MNAQSKRFLPIRVCTGAGCKAWGSEDLIQGLKEHTSQTHERVMLIPTKCLNNCGGGVTLKTALAKKLIKVRGKDRAEPNPFKKRLCIICSEVKYSIIKIEPWKFSVNQSRRNMTPLNYPGWRYLEATHFTDTRVPLIVRSTQLISLKTRRINGIPHVTPWKKSVKTR